MAAKRAGNRGLGRPKGSKNKVTVAVKEAVEQTFAANGGVEWMTTWAKDNPTEFFKLLGKLLPKELTGEDGGPIQHTVTAIVVKRDREFFRRSPIAGAVAASGPDLGESVPVQGGGVRPAVGENGTGPDGGA